MDNVLDAIRRMAWQRAKGELLSILETYYTPHGQVSSFDATSERIEKFIKDFEDNW
jgi:hypothetical protein